MAQRIACAKFPAWDGAKVVKWLTPTEAYVEHPRVPNRVGVISLDECAGVSGADDEADATLYQWSPVLRRWIEHSEGRPATMRWRIGELRRLYPQAAFWIRPWT